MRIKGWIGVAQMRCMRMVMSIGVRMSAGDKSEKGKVKNGFKR